MRSWIRVRGLKPVARSVRSLLLKTMRSPRTVTLFLVDRLLVPLWLRLLGVAVGRRCRFCGFPHVRLAQGASITLGDDVLINSRSDGNPAGLPHPTILPAVGPESA